MADASASKWPGRCAGLAYLAVFVFSIAGYVPLTSLLAGDAPAALGRLGADPALFNMALVSSVMGFLAWLVLGLELYRLMSAAGRTAGILMMIFVVGGVATNLYALAQLLPLAGSAGAGMDAATLAPIVQGYKGVLLQAQVFSGLWAFPFGWLVVRSRVAPRLLGYCLYFAGVFYLMVFATAFVPGLDQAPAFKILSTAISIPGEIVGEFGMCLWLLIMGARLPPIAPAPGSAMTGSPARA
jgi:hypothetical protein